jgi:hypothetical protein
MTDLGLAPSHFPRPQAALATTTAVEQTVCKIITTIINVVPANVVTHTPYLLVYARADAFVAKQRQG